jgi:DUF4097 and DUF4098 domain-containing protein YvlB
MTLTSDAGNLAADNYNATLKFTGKAGNVNLQNVQGQVTADTAAGNITAKVTGTGWTGAGLTAATQTGDIKLSHPATYQANFSAQTELGVASVDGKSATTPISGSPATVTAGSGPPITLKTGVGDVTVFATQ